MANDLLDTVAAGVVRLVKHREQVCDQFESAWQAGKRPAIEDFLPLAAGDERPHLFAELLALELEYRRDLGEDLRRDEYEARYPNYHDLLDRVINEFRDRTPLASQAHIETDDWTQSPEADAHHWPREFGDYVLLREIARGGMGVVYQARQRGLDRIVAVKMILSGLFASDQAIDRFRAEATSAARLQHPGIVTVHEVGQRQGQHFFSMDFVDGTSLQEMIQQQPLPGRQAARYVMQLAEAVHFAHNRGVVHRDLKPSNVLIDTDDCPKITDFGLAKRVAGDSDLTATGQVLGTPSYMPPEQAMGQADIGPASDIYSLGATLYAMLTGRPPFRAESTAATLLQVIENEPVAPRLLNSDIDRDLESICLKCLEKEPSRRYASAAELAVDLARYQRGETVMARPIGRPAKLWRWCRRQPLLAGLSAAVLVALLLGSGVSSYFALAAAERAEQAEEALARETDARQQLQTSLAAEQTAKRQARRAVDNYVTTLLEETTLKDRRFQPLAKRLLGGALEHYQQFIATNRNDPAAQRDLAEACLLVGQINDARGAVQQAVGAYQEALDVFQRRANEEDAPADQLQVAAIQTTLGSLQAKLGDSEQAKRSFSAARQSLDAIRPGERAAHWQQQLLRTLTAVASIERRTGEVAQAFATYEQAIAIGQQLADGDTKNPAYRSDLANAWENLAELQRDTDQADAALGSLDQSLQLRDEVARANVGEAKYQGELAGTLSDRSALLRMLGQLDDAETGYRRAIEIQTALVRDNPSLVQRQIFLSTTHHNLGILLAQRENHAEAIEHYRKALEIRERVAAESPDVNEYPYLAANTHNNLAVVLYAAGQQSEALDHYQAAAELFRQVVRDNPSISKYRLHLAAALHNLGALYFQRQLPQAAMSYFVEAVELYDRFYRQRKTYFVGSNLAACHYTMGRIQWQAEQWPVAATHFQSAVAIADDLAPQFPAIESDLAIYQHQLARFLASTIVP